MTQTIGGKTWALSQGAFSSAVFFALSSSYALAYLLYLFPGSELLWRLSVPVNALMRPAAQALDGIIGFAPETAIPLALALSLAPLTRPWRTTWMSSAISAHLAFFVIMLVVNGAWGSNYSGAAVASLGGVALPADNLGQIIPLLALAAASLAFCIASHVAYFKGQGQAAA